MAKFCGFCGAASEGGSFCTSCGQRFPGDSTEGVEPVGGVGATEQPTAQLPTVPAQPPTPPPAPPVAPAAPVPPPAPPASAAPAGAPVVAPVGAPPPAPTSAAPAWQGHHVPPAPAPRAAAPRAPVLNPFAGVPVGDYVRDAAAAVCLFATLGKPWDVDGDGTDHWWVILSALVAVASLAVPYVAKAGVVPGLHRDQAQVLKLALNAPVVVSVLAAVVNDVVHATDFLEGGLGPGVALALAGALFAAQPRAADEDVAHRDDRRWWAVSTAFVVVAVVIVVAEFVAFVLRDLTGDVSFLQDEPAELMSLIVAPLILVLALYGWSAREVVARRFQGVLVFGTLGLTAAAVALFTGEAGDGVFNAYSGFDVVEHWDSAFGGVFALSGAAALVLSRPSLRVAVPPHPVTGWLHTARLAFSLVAAGSFLVPVSIVLNLIAADTYPATAIADCVMWFVIALASCVVVSMLSGTTLNRPAVVALAAAVPVVGIVLVAVGRSGDETTVYLGAATTALLFTLPGLAICALTIPAPVRQTYGPLLPERAAVPEHPGAHQQPGPDQRWPAQPTQPPPPPLTQPPTQPPTQD